MPICGPDYFIKHSLMCSRLKQESQVWVHRVLLLLCLILMIIAALTCFHVHCTLEHILAKVVVMLAATKMIYIIKAIRTLILC